MSPNPADYFTTTPLPRSRAWLALIFAAAAFLSLGGILEFGAGSPMTHGQGIASYWAVFFAFHAVAFGGAALLGAFPALASAAVKAVWLFAAAALYAAAFYIWYGNRGDAPLLAWLSHWRSFAPALLPLVCGGLWGSTADAAS